MVLPAILNANRNYEVLGSVDIPQVIGMLLEGKIEFQVSTELHPIAQVWMDPVALQPFIKSCDCYRCGLKGHQFVIRRNPHDKKSKWGQWHLTLFTETGQMMTCDHIVPKSQGGTDDPSNLGTLCRRCNTKKADKPVEQFLKGTKNVQTV